MNDLRALHEAFEELERRADAATARAAFEPSPRRRTRAARLAPVAVAAAVVAGVATGAALLVPGADPAPPAGPQPAASSAPTSTTPPPPAHQDPEVLAERFRAVLGDLATFTVTGSGPGAVVMTLPPPGPPANPEPGSGTGVGAAIVGTLTSAGVTGGFDLLRYPGTSTDAAWCSLPEEPGCSVRELPDGSVLATGRFSLQVPGGVTNEVKLVRPDGLVFVMHVSNVANPKGTGARLGDQPPLTVDQMVAVATSDRW